MLNFKFIRFSLSSFFLIAMVSGAMAQWQLLDAATDRDLLDVHFYTPNYGVAVGDGATIRITEDGGENWVWVPAPQLSRAIYSVLVLGIDTFLITQNHDTYDRVYLTTNRGQSWQYVNDGGLIFNTTERVISARRGSLTEDVWHSDDGGVSWEEAEIDLQNYPFFDKLDFANTEQGIILGHVNSIKNYVLVLFRSEDAGTNWQKLNATSLYYSPVRGDAPTSVTYPHPDTALLFTNVTHYFSPTDSNRLIRMTDFNADEFSWEVVNDYLPGLVYDTHFFDGNNGIAVLKGGDIIETTDGGVNWETTYYGSEWLRRVFAYDENLKFVVGENGTILRSGTPPSNVKERITTSLKMSPNPCKDEFTIWGLPGKMGQLYIYNSLGQVVYSEEWSNNKVSTDDLKSGVYHVVLAYDQYFYVGQLVKTE